MRTDADLSKLVNQSGFPLQLAIDELVSSQTESVGWKVLYREHGWRNVDGQTGFIDLVLQDCHGTSVLAIECKRVLDAEWLFLDVQAQNRPAPAASGRTRLWATYIKSQDNAFTGYYDARVSPVSTESMYCVVAGQDQKSRPMLERIAAEIAAATEALAIEEHPILTKRSYGLRMYAPVIVTTARLVLSSLDPRCIERSTGEARELSHTVVPWVRFRKQFSPDFAVEPSNDWDLAEIGFAKEKTVYVVNVNELERFLSQWEVDANSLRALI